MSKPDQDTAKAAPNVHDRGVRWGVVFGVVYGLTVILGLAAFFVDLWIFNTHSLVGPAAFALAAVPGVVTCTGLYLLWRSLVPIDEFQARYMRDAVFATLALGSAVMVVWGSICQFTKVPSLGGYVFPMYAVCWAICAPFIAWKRYR